MSYLYVMFGVVRTRISKNVFISVDLTLIISVRLVVIGLFISVQCTLILIVLFLLYIVCRFYVL